VTERVSSKCEITSERLLTMSHLCELLVWAFFALAPLGYSGPFVVAPYSSTRLDHQYS
jgi:hypothetical protein